MSCSVIIACCGAESFFVIKCDSDLIIGENVMHNPYISLVLLRNVVDESGKPVGHAYKQIKQSCELLRAAGYKSCQIEVMASKENLDGLDVSCKTPLPFSIVAGQYSDREDKYKLYLNYLYAKMKCKSKIVWFVLVSEVIVKCIGILPFHQKQVATTFYNWDTYIEHIGKKKALRREQIIDGLNKLSLCIATNPSYKPKRRFIHLPDYYQEQRQKELCGISKENKVVCVGEMRRGKGIDKLIKAFSKQGTNLQLEIHGSFSDRELLNELKKMKRSNIHIFDKNLSDDEYLEVIASAKYVALPYDMRDYSRRTSGVLLDCIFVGGIPVAPQELLNNNEIQGIGYDNISEILKKIMDFEHSGKIIENDLSKYDFGQMGRQLKRALKSLT